MPVFLTKNILPDDISARHLAEKMLLELNNKKEDQYNFLNYWFDAKSNTVFCLFSAVNEKIAEKRISEFFGTQSTRIVPIDLNEIEKYMGIGSMPIEQTDIDFIIENQTALRFIMIIEKSSYLKRLESNQFSLFAQKFHNSVLKSINQFKGTIVKRDNNNYLVSFKSVSNAVFCALKIQANFKYITPKFDSKNRTLKLALTSGLPITDSSDLFDSAIVLATRMCEIVKNQLVISDDVKELYASENKNTVIDSDRIRTLHLEEEKFLTNLMNYVDKNWQRTDIRLEEFAKDLGFTISQLHYRIVKLTGKPPIGFIKEYKLKKAIKLLHEQNKSIATIANQCGFNSATYFSKCFKDRFGILPSKYVQQHYV